MHADIFEEADCFRVFRDFRAGVEDGGGEIGKGYNCFPISESLVDLVKRSIDYLRDNERLEQYTSDDDEDEKRLCCQLIKRLYGLEALSKDDLIFTNGASESISIALGGIACAGQHLALPAPTYYCYEQSALRHRVEVGARYRCSPRGHRVSGSGECQAAVVVQPNAVTGHDGRLPLSLETDELQFRVVDIVFQVALGDGHEAARLDHLITEEIQKVDLSRSALILTPSKDLSAPSFRAGLLATRNETVKHFAIRDRYERSFSVSPLIGHIFSYYFSILLMLRARALHGEEAMRAEYEAVADLFHECRCGFLPSFEDFEKALIQIRRMARHCTASVAVLREFEDLFHAEDLVTPLAGFSCFPRLRREFPNHQEFCRWVNRLGLETQLLLNPSVMFGGTFDSWNELFDGEARIRVNLSGPQEELRQNLETLRRFDSA